MNTYPFDHAILGSHCPRDLRAPCPANVRAVARLQTAMARIAAANLHKKLQLPAIRLVSATESHGALIDYLRSAS